MHNAGMLLALHKGNDSFERISTAMEGLKELGVTVLLSSRVDLKSAEDHNGKRTLRTVDGRRIGAELVVSVHL